MKRTTHLAVVLVAVAAAGSAAAQNYVVGPPVNQAFVPVPGTATDITPSSVDDGLATISLPFSFPYYGQNYGSISVSTNGLVFFPPNGCTSIECRSNTDVPSTSRTAFHTAIALWWADLNGSNAGSTMLAYSPSPTEFVIEWRDWNYYWGTASFSMQLWLSSTGIIKFHYGTHAGAGDETSVGFENQDGTQGAALLACSPTCGASNWPTNTLFTIGQPVEPDLTVQEVAVSNFVTGAQLNFTVQPTFRNFGQNPANNFLWRAYLSTDRVLDGADSLVFTATTPVSVPAGATFVSSGAAVANPVPPPGQYYVLVEADHTNVVVECVPVVAGCGPESNNVGSSSAPFIKGLDLSATSISGPTSAGPNSNITVNVKWANIGSDVAPSPVQFKIWLSADAVLGNDFNLYTGSRNVTGGQGFDENLSIAVPANVPGGDLYYLLEVDSSAAIAEVREDNNVAASSGKVAMQQAELAADGVDFVDVVTGAPTRVGYFGQTGRFTVVIRNAGGAAAQSFKVGLAISIDNSLSLLSDTIVHDEQVSGLAPGASTTVSFNFDLPLKDRSNKDFATGAYYLFAIVDSFGVITELSEANNTLSVGPVTLRAPAPDYVVTVVEGPAIAAVGEVVPVFRAFKNVGNVDGAQVAYRFFASANEIVTSDDVPLAIVGAGGATTEAGTVTLAVGAESTATELVKLPPTMPPGTYYLGAIIDTGGVVAELDETNNGQASMSTSLVAPSSLKITSQQLPDGVIDRPYSFRLVAAGAQEPVSWSFDATTGSLPAGISLSADGLLSGTPTVASVSAFTVVAISGAKSSAARLVLRVLPTTTQLEFTTTALPPVVNSSSVPYLASLGAAGGSKPYTFSIVSGSLPNGVTMSSDGLFSGAAGAGVTVGERQVTFEVRDALGSQARKELRLRIVEPGALIIRTLAVPDSLVNGDYLTDLTAQNADGSPLATPLVWSVAAGALPDGLVLTSQGDERGLIEGKPLVAGTYEFTIQVEDAKGRVDVVDFLLRVFPVRFRLSLVGPPETLFPGDEVRFTVAATGAASPRFRIYAGRLPAGLSLSEGGEISGVVSDQGSVGVYNFVLEATDGNGASGLGAFTLEVLETPRSGGCGAAPGGSPLALLPLLASLLFLARRRRGVLGAIAGLVLLGASSASAQVAYQVVGPSAATFQTLTGGTALNSVSTYSSQVVSLPFAMRFFGQSYSSVTVSLYGYLAFSGDGTIYTNPGMPTTTSYSYVPVTVIAPWWDNLDDIGTTRCTGSNTCINYRVIGSSPNRAVVIEWRNVIYAGATGNPFSFQVWLYEGTGQIRMAYDGRTPGSSSSASVGINFTSGEGVSGLACTTAVSGSCGQASFPRNQTLDFVLPPDLMITQVGGEPLAYAGAPFRLTARLANGGGRAATGATVRYYLSSNNVWDAADWQLADSAPVEVPAGGSVLVTATGTIPAGTAPGTYFVFSKADPDNGIGEIDETNNEPGPFTIPVSPPAPDLKITSISGPANAVPGQSVNVSRTIVNAGSAAVPSTSRYTIFLSDNSVVTISDRALYSGTLVALAAGASDTQPDTVNLPGDLSAGIYWLGLCVDYDPGATPTSTIQEISEVNNCTSATTGVVVSTGALTILSTTLPEATQYAPYGQPLVAAGGDGSYSWTLNAGQLPSGVSLASNGTLSGTPSEAGSFGFEAKVTSGAASATASFSLTVGGANIPLAVVDQELPAAELGRGYSAKLVAVGGRPPYVWKLAADTRLPVGLALASDGTIEGRASESGEIPFRIEATDQTGTTAAKDLSLLVVSPSRLQFGTTKLATAYLGKDYLQPLQAIGGKPPYDWAVVKFQQLAENPTEEPGDPSNTLPPEMGLALDEDASGKDLIRGVPAKAGLFAVTLRILDAAGSEDLTTLPLRVSYEEALAITTTTLPDAFVGQAYAARLSHNGGAKATDVVFLLPCVKQAEPNLTDFSCISDEPTQSLPKGLTLSGNGELSGVAEMPAGVRNGPDGKPPPVVFSFLVKVTDGSGRQDVRGLSIRVRSDDVRSSGCSGAGFEPSLLALAVVSFLILRRRKAAVAGAAAITTILLGCSEPNLCIDRNVRCDAPLACDPGDGVCKCGGRGGVVCGDGFSCDALTSTCLSTLCSAVTCGGGTSCDVYDGKCKCGGTGGGECGATDICNPATKLCEPALNCSQVACPKNQTCDLSSSRCKCGETECGAGQFCSPSGASGEKTCIENLCSGVTCSGTNQCDPADGFCKCNGVICQGGEACSCPAGSDAGQCADSERACTPGNGCLGVTCAGGATCDPTDGQCKCGGPGGPVCTSDQLCALGPPAQCQGGEQCTLPGGAPKVCTGGASCDPEDGKCKCGGRGGAVCQPATGSEPAEVCVSSVLQQSCKRPCDPRSPDCPAGTYCYFDSSAATPVAYCAAPTGTRIEGQSCTNPTACFRENPPTALHCNGLIVGTSGVCRAYCDVTVGNQSCAQVPQAHVCTQLQSAATGYGYCQPQ